MTSPIRHLPFILFCTLLISTKSNAQWVNTNCPSSYDISVAASGPNVFVGTYGDGVYSSTDNGENWSGPGLPTNQRFVYHIGSNSSRAFAGPDSGLYISTDAGATWNNVPVGLPPQSWAVFCFFFKGDTVIAGGGYGILRSTDNGSTWVYTGFEPITNIFCLASDETNVYAGTYDGLYSSTNTGLSWQRIAFPDTLVFALAASHNNLVVSTWGINGSGNLVGFVSTDQGLTWIPEPDLSGVKKLISKGDYLFSDRVSVSADGGFTWRYVGDGLYQGSIYDLTASDSYLFAATAGGLYRRPLSEMITSVHEVSSNENPRSVVLAQNYPNPFNPTTTIEFSLPKAGFASLKIFNIIGEEIATIASQEMKAGAFRTQWDASEVPSGVYFYRLQAGDFVQTRKLIVTK